MTIKLAVIAGSGGYDLLKNNLLGSNLECDKINTPFGESAPVHRFELNGTSFFFLSRHGEKRYSLSAPFVNYRANIWALKEYGVERILSWSGPGIINKEYSVGEFVIPHDIIDETKNRKYTFFEKKGIGFIRQQSPFCEEIRKEISNSLQNLSFKFKKEGVYVCTEGPRLETPAEIRKYKASGADMVGMTLVPEAFLARELEMCYAPACYLTNYAEGVSDRPFQKGELFEGMVDSNERKTINESVSQFPAIIQDLFQRLNGLKRSCFCKDAMLRYKKEGIISEDWHTWIK